MTPNDVLIGDRWYLDIMDWRIFLSDNPITLDVPKFQFVTEGPSGPQLMEGWLDDIQLMRTPYVPH